MLLALHFAALVLAQLDIPKEPVAAGEITNARTGEPLRKAFVTLQRGGQAATLETTNPEGKFRFDDLPEGEYQLKVERAGFAARQLRVTLPDRQLRLKLDPLAAIHGRVTDEDGDPLPGVRVRVLRAESLFGTSFFSLVATVNAAPDGAYRADDLAPGRYYLHAESAATGLAENVKRVVRPAFYPGVSTPLQATPVEALAGVTLGDTNIRLPWKPAYTIRGRVEYLGPAKAELRLYPDLGTFVMEWNHRSVPLQGETFEIKNVPEGEYVVRAIAGVDNEWQTRLRLAVAAEVTGLRIKPELVPAIQVRIEKEEGDCQAPAWILFPRQPGMMPVGLSAQKAARVLPGDYRVVTSENGNCFATWLKFNGQAVVEDVVVAGDGVWQARLSGETGEIEGRLVEGAKVAAGGATAVLVPEVPEARLPLFLTAAADNQGRFRFENVAPGRYRLHGQAAFREPADLEVVQQWRVKGQTIVVEADRRVPALLAVE